jgi:hypothetical protein
MYSRQGWGLAIPGIIGGRVVYPEGWDVPEPCEPSVFCGCCGDEVVDLEQMSTDERVKLTDNVGMKQILQVLPPMDSLAVGPEGEDLIRWCSDFLTMKQNENGAIRESLYDFVKGFLCISDYGQAHWLMSMLEWRGLLEHGISIRCGWWDSHNPVHVVHPTREQDVHRWLDTGIIRSRSVWARAPRIIARFMMSIKQKSSS